MVTVNKLTDPKTHSQPKPNAVAQIASQAMIDPNDPFAGSIGTETAVATQMPAVQETACYIAHVSYRSKSYAQFQAKGFTDGDLYLAKDGENIKLDGNVKFWLMESAAFLTDMNDAGKVWQSSPNLQATNLSQNAGEHIVAVLIADVNGKLIPAQADFRTTKVGAVTKAHEEIKASVTPDWMKISERHAVAAQAPLPFMRVTFYTWCRPRTSRSSGNPYSQATSRVEPTAGEDIVRLANAIQDKEFRELVVEARQKAHARRAEIMSVAK